MPIDLDTLVDLSYPIASGMPVSKKERPVLVVHRLTHRESGYCASSIEMGSHTGTHIDAPFHFFEDGIGVDRIPLRSLITAGHILDLRSAPKAIDAGVLNQEADRMGGLVSRRAVVLWTGWERFFGEPQMHDHPYLTEDAARALIESGTTVVGIDAIGVDDSLGSRFPAHHLLLRAGVPIVENLRGLEALGAGPCGLGFVPISLADADAAPVRAFGWRMP